MAFPRDGRAVANDTLFSHPHEVSSVAGFVVFAVHLPSQLISRLCSSPPGWAGPSRPPPPKSLGALLSVKWPLLGADCSVTVFLPVKLKMKSD